MRSTAPRRSQAAPSLPCTTPQPTSAAASAPPEILERIFRFAITGELDVPSKAWQLRHSGVRNYQVPLVNRHWNGPATRILYWQLHVIERLMEWKWRTNALLARTLEESPRLQVHVRTLYLDVRVRSGKYEEQVGGLSVRILRCCPLVQHLWIFGRTPSLLDGVLTAITTFTKLRYLYVSSYMNDPFCSFARLEAMMDGWPNLERLKVEGDIITDDSGHITQSDSKPPMETYIPRLDLARAPRSLEGFTRIVPNLGELSLESCQEPDLFLPHLQKWKSTLRCLKLRLTTPEADWEAITTGLCVFERLHKLVIRGKFPLRFLKLSELPDTLEELKLMVRRIDLPILFEVLGQKLPHSIQTVDFCADYGVDSDDPRRDIVQELHAFCEKRHWKYIFCNWRRHRISIS